MTIRELYDAIGGNYDQAIRVMKSDRLIDKYIRKLKSSNVGEMLEKAGQSMDATALFESAHAMKGVWAWTTWLARRTRSPRNSAPAIPASCRTTRCRPSCRPSPSAMPPPLRASAGTRRACKGRPGGSMTEGKGGGTP